MKTVSSELFCRAIYFRFYPHFALRPSSRMVKRCPWSTSLHIPRLYHTNNSFIIRKILTFFLPVLEATWWNISTTWNSTGRIIYIYNLYIYNLQQANEFFLCKHMAFLSCTSTLLDPFNKMVNYFLKRPMQKLAVQAEEKNGDYNRDGKKTPWRVTAFLGSEPVVGLVWAPVCLGFGFHFTALLRWGRAGLG